MFFDLELEELLLSLEKEAEKNWNVSREVGFLLYLITKRGAAKRVLEIGTSTGYSTLFFAKALAEKAGHGEVVTIESNVRRFEVATETFKKSGLLDQIHSVKGHAPEIFLQNEAVKKGAFDLVFLDATKEEYVEYFDQMQSLLSVNALIIADNVLSHAEAVGPFLKKVSENKAFRMEILPIGKGLAVIEKL